jgi:3-phenylpropionate/trans-cinnamate dioxygenase ferredoxin reductase subunit
VAERHADVLLIGGGPASDACAAELREQGFEGSIMLVARELDAPYDRPSCSKQLLRGESSREDILLRDPGYWAEQEIELLTRTSVLKLDTGSKLAKLSTKQEVSFGNALLATGSMVRRLNIDGSDLEGIHYLRAPGNTERIRAELDGAERCVLVGGSFIGCEVAASLTMLGKQATIVMQEREPLERVLGRDAGRWVRGLLESRGVEVIGGADVAGYSGGDDGEVTGVRLASGRELPAELVVVGAGVTPDVMLARGAGLELGESGGVLCDEHLESSAAGIWAAGDICEYASTIHSRRVRVEHWEAATAQGRQVARAIEYVGPAQKWSREVLRGSEAAGKFSRWYVQDGRVVAALAIGRSDDLQHAARLITERSPLGKDGLAVLADTGAELGTIG